MAGTPGACSQAFCHPIRCMRHAFISTETCSLYHRQNHHHHHHHHLGVWFRADFVLASFPYPSGWPVMAERAVRSAARRRERWLRSMWRHEQLSVRMAVATASHHSWKSHAVVGTQNTWLQHMRWLLSLHLPSLLRCLLQWLNTWRTHRLSPMQRLLLWLVMFRLHLPSPLQRMLQ